MNQDDARKLLALLALGGKAPPQPPKEAPFQRPLMPQEVDEVYSKLVAQLDRYVSGYDHLPKQRSAGWAIGKQTTIGGSEMAIFTGTNEYETLQTLVAKKIGLSGKSRPVGIQAWWGNLFETVIRQHTARVYETQIVGDDIWITTQSDSSYSPDGLGVVNLPRTFAALDETGRQVTKVQRQPQIALFEFKCPYSRIPNGEIPPQYIPQIKTGLEIIDIAHCSIFGEAVFRRCSWEDCEFTPAFDRTLVPRASGRDIVAIGFVGFYSMRTGEMEAEMDVLQDLMTAEGYSLNDTNDIGTLSPPTFTRLMRLFDAKHMSTWYSDTIYPTTPAGTLDAELREFSKFASPYYTWGILPWKMFRCDFHIAQRTPGYLDPYKAKIAEVIGLIRKCRANPSKAQDLFNEYFGHSSHDDGYTYE